MMELGREARMFLTTKDLERCFQARLESSCIDISTAWATCGPVMNLFYKAVEDRDVQIRAIVGTYGDATHPDALERLRDIGTLVWLYSL